MTTTDYTKPVTLIRLTSPFRLSVVEFAYTPRYSRWTVLKYSPEQGQTASDAWGNGGQNDLANPDRIHTVTYGNATVDYGTLRNVIGELCLTGWVLSENRPYTGPSGSYECNAANAAEREKNPNTIFSAV